MSISRKILYLLLAMAAMLFLPWLGGYFYYNGNFPGDFYAYPPLKPIDKPGFNLPIFIFVAIVCLGITTIYVKPKWFGFKKFMEEKATIAAKVNLPVWFWFGLISWTISLAFLAFHLARDRGRAAAARADRGRGGHPVAVDRAARAARCLCPYRRRSGGTRAGRR